MNSTYIPATCGKLTAHPLSLLMILHKCHEYYEFSSELTDVRNTIVKIADDEDPDENELMLVSRTAKKALALLVSLLGVSSTVLDHVEDLGAFYSEVASGPTSVSVLGDLETIRGFVEKELEARKFLLIPPPQDRMIRLAEPFGAKVQHAFPSAITDLVDAHSAYAVDLYTASVFHFMRAVEYAMRALAWDRRIKTRTHAGRIYPIDLATWEDILKELDKEFLKITQWPRNRGKMRVQATEFYGTAIQELRGFKDAWRNHIMHSRRSYLKQDADQVMIYVERFMTTLASRISEQERTPNVWTTKQLL